MTGIQFDTVREAAAPRSLEQAKNDYKSTDYYKEANDDDRKAIDDATDFDSLLKAEGVIREKYDKRHDPDDPDNRPIIGDSGLPPGI
jgi:hypothetical protein